MTIYRRGKINLCPACGNPIELRKKNITFDKYTEQKAMIGECSMCDYYFFDFLTNINFIQIGEKQ